MTDPRVIEDSAEPPAAYRREPEFDAIIRERDVAVAMRDGAKLVVDVYRPGQPQRFPALVAFGAHTKEIQGPDYPSDSLTQPAWSSLWVGHMEAGDTRFFVSRGYVHVVASPRAFGKSDGEGSRQWDSYDLIEWAAAQPWCDGRVGMVGIGAFAAEQFHAAKQNPPHLEDDLSLRRARRLWPARRLPRGFSGRPAQSVPLHAGPFFRAPSQPRQARRVDAGARSAVARSDGEPGLSHVSASATRADHARPAHAGDV